jgi:hypothetical protein
MFKYNKPPSAAQAQKQLLHRNFKIVNAYPTVTILKQTFKAVFPLNILKTEGASIRINRSRPLNKFSHGYPMSRK